MKHLYVVEIDQGTESDESDWILSRLHEHPFDEPARVCLVTTQEHWDGDMVELVSNEFGSEGWKSSIIGTL